MFALYLPFRQPHSSADEGTAYKAGQKRILVVEDIEVNFMQINAFLKKEYTILWVTNGEEAVKSFLRDTPDLILMDIRMPVMNGIEATAKIRTMSADIPIIAVTAHAFIQNRSRRLLPVVMRWYLNLIPWSS